MAAIDSRILPASQSDLKRRGSIQTAQQAVILFNLLYLAAQFSVAK
jgi:hypothetical protein